MFVIVMTIINYIDNFQAAANVHDILWGASPPSP